MSFFSRQYFERGVQEGHYIKYEHSVRGIEVFIKVGTPRIFIFDGRKKKPSQILCKDDSELVLAIEKRLRRVHDKNVEKMRQKEADKQMAEENRAKIQVGDYISEAKKCQINKRGDIVKADEFGHTAYKTDPNKEHYTSWD